MLITHAQREELRRAGWTLARADGVDGAGDRLRPVVRLYTPDAAAYHAAPADGPGLVMPVTKPSCKERWRRVLAEAGKISRKHLLALEPGISMSQADQLQAPGLQLVIPLPLHDTCLDRQRMWFLSLSDSVIEVGKRQAAQ